MKTAHSKRLSGIDLARAVAIGGMIIDHVNRNIGTSPFTGPRWLVWLNHQLEGRVAALFILLAGIGMALMARTMERRPLRGILYRRSAALFVIGLLFHFVWDADILHYIGVFMAIGTLFLFARPAWLWAGAVCANAVFATMLLGLNAHPAWAYDAGWDWNALTYTDFWTPTGFARGLIYNGWFPVLPWVGFLLIGIGVGRLDLRARATRLRLMAGGAALTAAAGLAGRGLARHVGPKWLGMPQEVSNALFGLECMPPSPVFFLQAAATAVLIVGLCLELAELPGTDRKLRPALVFGQYALSLYPGHVFLFILPLYLSGWDGHPLDVSIAVGVGATGVAVVLCDYWHRRFARGPLEALLRRIGQPRPRA